LAHAVFAGNEADTDPLADFPFGHSAAQGFNATNNLVPWDTRQSETWVNAHDGGGIGVTDSTCFHPNADLTISRLSDRPFHYSKHSGRRDFYCFVCAFHLYVPVMAFSFWPNDQPDRLVEAILNLFPSPSIRECREGSSRASRHLLRNAPESRLRRDRLREHLSGLE